MITRQELELHARVIEKRAYESRMESLRTSEQNTAGDGPSLPLFTFPTSTIHTTPNEGAPLQVQHRARRVDAVEVRSGLHFRLVEEEVVTDAAGHLLQRLEPVVLVSAKEAIEPLRAGFRRVDEDRLAESVAPIVEQVRTPGLTVGEADEAVSRIQQLTAGLDLSAASQLRVKSDAFDLVDGRLDVSEFVSRTVARQEGFEAVQHVRQSVAFTESIEV